MRWCSWHFLLFFALILTFEYGISLDFTEKVPTGPCSRPAPLVAHPFQAGGCDFGFFELDFDHFVNS